MHEDGEAIPFATTYSQGDRDQMIRGRTSLDALSVEPSSSDSELTAVIEDYVGNQATTLLRRGD